MEITRDIARSFLIGAGALALLATSVTTAAALTDAEKCSAQKMKVAGKYVFCRVKAAAKAIKTAATADFTKCDAKFAAKWAKIEAKAAGACPAGADLQGLGDIAIADAGLIAGTVSAAPRFQNNGNGTTSDLNTGLTWENKSYNDDSVNDIITGYTFQEVVSVHLATLNGASFGGHSDWRFPTPNEMLSLINFKNPGEIKSYPEFDFNCDFVCNMGICPSPSFDAITSNCAFSELWGSETFWTSTTNPEDSTEAIAVANWGFILETEERKTSDHRVIAVRGGRRSD